MHTRSCGFFGGTTFSPTCCSDCSCSSHQSSCPRFISFPHSFNNSGWWKYSHIDNVSAPLLELRACERLFCLDRVGFGRIRKRYSSSPDLGGKTVLLFWGQTSLTPHPPPTPPVSSLPSWEHRGKGNEVFCLPEVERVSVSRGVSGR